MQPLSEPSAAPHPADDRARNPTAMALLERRLRGGLNALERKGRLRGLQPERGLDLSSNDYLGLADHPTIRAAMIAALESGLPLGSGGSRLLRGNRAAHIELERELALRLRREAVLIFNSGYEANVGLLSTLIDAGDQVFADAYIHASMHDGIRQSRAHASFFAHNDLEHLERLLQQANANRSRFIVVESLYSMDGDRAPLRELAALSRRFEAFLIVDEAHATGLFGQSAMGLLDEPDLRELALASVHTCGKAWASFGAFVACSTLVRDYLVNRCRPFIFTTALPPVLLAQWQAALRVIDAEPERAQLALAHAERFRERLRGIANLGHSNTQIVPLILGEDAKAVAMAQALQNQGFDVRAIRPPTVPRGSARLRLAFNARLTADEVDRLAEACGRFLGQS